LVFERIEISDGLEIIELIGFPIESIEKLFPKIKLGKEKIATIKNTKILFHFIDSMFIRI